MLNKPRITEAHAHIYKLEKIFNDWTKGKVSEKEFISMAAIEIQEALKVLNHLISQWME